MTDKVSKAVRHSIEEAYAAFNRRDTESALALMSPGVVWANGMEGGVVVGHEAVRDYWTRQWTLVDPHVEPVAFAGEDGRVIVTVHQRVRDKSGNLISEGRVHHVYEFEHGLVRSMEIQPEA